MRGTNCHCSKTHIPLLWRQSPNILFIFSMKYGMSKSALNDFLQCEKSSLPQTYILPSSYTEAKSLISPLLIPVEKYDAYINDCFIDQDSSQFQYLSLSECPVCQVPRISCKIFTYMPLGPRLARWYGTFNLCKLIHSNKISVSKKKEFFRILQMENYLILGSNMDRCFKEMSQTYVCHYLIHCLRME